MDKEKFGKRLSTLMARHGIKDNELASRTGISRSMVARYRNGKSEPSVDALIAMARYFGKSIEFILGEDDLRVSDKSCAVAFTYEIADVCDRKIMETLVDKYRGAFNGGNNG